MPENTTRILIIDDEPDTRANLVDILDMFGFVPFTAESGATALAHAELSSADVIILDRKLPDTMADDLLPKLIEQAPSADIIIATGYGDLDSTIGALRAGASDYLLKPINPDALRLSIERILERNRVEARLLQAERLAAIGKAMTGLAHESRNALQRSQASLDLLAAELAGNEFACKLIQRIRAAQDDLHRLYEDVREYARPIHISPRLDSVKDLLERAWLEMIVKREGRDVSFSIESDTDDFVCEIESFLIRQVFHNILDNALAACSDPVVIKVTLSATEFDKRAALQVRITDNGPGLTAEAVGQAFEEFFTTKTHGTGLGLAIAQRFIDAHNGSIAASNTSQGLAVTITLPRRHDRSST